MSSFYFHFKWMLSLFDVIPYLTHYRPCSCSCARLYHWTLFIPTLLNYNSIFRSDSFHVSCYCLRSIWEEYRAILICYQYTCCWDMVSVRLYETHGAPLARFDSTAITYRPLMKKKKEKNVFLSAHAYTLIYYLCVRKCAIPKIFSSISHLRFDKIH